MAANYGAPRLSVQAVFSGSPGLKETTMTINTVVAKRRSAEILLVEDNMADSILAKKAFDIISIPCNLTIAESGDEAIKILRGKNAHDLVLLDLNLPGKSGIDVLRELRIDTQLSRIPVIVLTTSRAEKDVTACYELLANSYVIKPLDFTKFVSFVEALAQFWFGYAISPYE
jgi:CheY-like chemotaxis protein